MHENKLLKNIGNAFIALSFFGFVFTYFPLIQTYLFPPAPIAIPEGSDALFIAKIHAQAPLISDVDPWNKQEYLEALSHGVAQAKGTAHPGESGTVYIFAHSSDAPWRLTRYNTIFYKLNELSTGDEIHISYHGEKYRYTVREKKVVWPTEIEYLTESSGNQLILQTCYPIGTDFKRLLVFADPVAE